MHGPLTFRSNIALRAATTWAVGGIVAAFGLVFVVGPSVMNGRIPGDPGDTRFISYVLEHLFRWMAGQDASLWSASFFYPFPLTIAFGDSFLGNGFVYAIFRLAGFVREDAYRLWYVTGFAVNFATACYALVRLGYSRLAAALGAFLFTFGIPVTAQEGHAQLVYRFGVPLAVLALEDFRARKQLYQLALVAFWTAWQFYCSIYIGYFLVLLLICIMVGHILCYKGNPLRSIRALALEMTRLWSGSGISTRVAVLLITMALGALMVLLLLPYAEVSRLYRFQRQWAEIAYMLPRPASYLLASNSRIWPSTGPLFNALPMRHEHAMFVGAAPLLAIAVAVVLCLIDKARLGGLFAPITVAVILLILLTLFIKGHSAYSLLALLPGADAIRAVTRIITVLLFALAILFAASLDAIAEARLTAPLRWATVAFLGVLLMFENSYIVHRFTMKRDWQAQMTTLAAQIPDTIPQSPILLLSPKPADPAPWIRELDAMLFAQDHGWRTVNGYSGNSPPRPELTGGCQDAAVALVSGLTFLGRSTEKDYLELLHHLLMVGYPPCDPAALLQPPQVTAFAGPLPTRLMANVSLRIERLSLFGGQIVISAAITNNSSLPLPAVSTTAMPIRLSPRFVDNNATPTALQDLAGWNLRQPIGFDIPSGATHSIVFSVNPPTHPGTYRVAISLVQDGAAWFHSYGMDVPVSTQTVDVGTDHMIHLLDSDH